MARGSVPAPPVKKPVADVDAAGKPEKIQAAASTRLFTAGFVTPPPKTEEERAKARATGTQSKISDQPPPPPAPAATDRPKSDTGKRGPARRAMSVTRPAWISAALEGKSDVERGTKVSLGPGNVVPGTRYKITKWLGDGGMGVVYEAEHVDLGRKAALKVLRAELCRNPEALRMFREEARAASRLGDEAIVDVFDFAELPDGRLLFAMELLDGRALSDEIAEVPIEPARAIGILRQICKGLSVAHDAGIIHRDVKPDNIALVVRRGRADAVKILDFGIATIVGEHADGPISAGSPYYLAPELVAGLPFDLRADIYALGCTAYEMLTGVPPMRGETVEDVLRAHLEQEPEPPSNRAADVPAALDDVILKCLAKDPKDRYRDLRELEAALCEAQIAAKLQTTWDDLPIPDIADVDRRERILRAMPDPAASMVMLRPKNRWGLAAAAIALVLGGGALALSLQSNDDQAAQDTQVTQLVRRARAEAALHYYVYPPSEQPDRATAYTVVKELEQLGKDGKKQAKQLRTEFAETLVRLGGQYWDREGGKAFAIDYYAQALVFDPDNETARERGTMTPGQLAALEEKASKGDFTEGELAAVEPLVVLAQDTQEGVEAGLSQLAEKDGVLASSTEASLEKLVGKKLARRRPAPKPAHEDEGELEDDAGEEAGPADGPKASAPAGGGARDKAGAAALVADGQAALKAGKRGEAQKLFEQALTKDRRNAEALMGLSDLEFSHGNYPKAVRFAERATRAAPKNDAYFLKLGDAYYKVLRYEEARDAYAKAQQLGNAKAERRLTRVERKLGG